jgi:hypothetical protein
VRLRCLLYRSGPDHLGALLSQKLLGLLGGGVDHLPRHPIGTGAGGQNT